MNYAALLQSLTVLVGSRVEVYFAINYVCSMVCLTLTMHRYIRFLLDHYRPLVHAKHLERLDMMRTLTYDKQSMGHGRWLQASAGRQENELVLSALELLVRGEHQRAADDGGPHGYVADYLERTFNKRILRMLDEKAERCGDHIYEDHQLIEQSISDEVERIDADLAAQRFARISYTGSTLISALVDHNRYLTDHKRRRLASERERIERAGGFVEYFGVERVQGLLAVSRAFGDTAFKEHRFVIVEPEVRRIDLNVCPLRYVVLASDGFWDVVSSHEAVLEVNYLLQRDADVSAEDLAREELVGAEDDCSQRSDDLSTATTLTVDEIERLRRDSTATSRRSSSGSTRSCAFGPDGSFTGTDIAAHLVQLALKRRSPDNVSVFFVRLDRF
ncbi:G protein-coupled receptor [Aphelenchoides fujianensis]|nr:G protein-coupled receptor [Aphelenchoides fujianensis]